MHDAAYRFVAGVDQTLDHRPEPVGDRFPPRPQQPRHLIGPVAADHLGMPGASSPKISGCQREFFKHVRSLRCGSLVARATS
jgi:hypothetical protein